MLTHCSFFANVPTIEGRSHPASRQRCDAAHYTILMINTIFQPDGLAIIEMADPSGLNAIDAQFAESLADAVRTVSSAENVRLVLLRSAGRCFGVGGNVSWFDVGREGLADRIRTTLDSFAEVIQGLRSMPAIVVAAVNGSVAGGSLGLLFAADFVIAQADARFSMAYTKIGATPDAATSYFLTRQLGERRALELLLLSESFGAERAKELGLVNIVVPRTGFEDECSQLVDRLLNGPTAAFLATKSLVQAATGSTLPEHMDREAQTFVEISRSRDFLEGVGAFLSKRSPKFAGN